MSDEHGVATGKQYPGNAPSATTGECRAEQWHCEHVTGSGQAHLRECGPLLQFALHEMSARSCMHAQGVQEAHRVSKALWLELEQAPPCPQCPWKAPTQATLRCAA